MSVDIIGGFPTVDPLCAGCGKELLVENAWMTDGCPCNSRLGVNSMNETRWRLLMLLQQQQSRLIEGVKGYLAGAMLPLLVVVLLLCASSSDACERCGLFGQRCAFRQVQAVHVQQVVAPIVYPQVNYFVGAPIRVEAIVQRSLQENPEYAEFQRFRAWKQTLEAQQPTVPLNKPTETIPENIPTSLLAQKCGTCHGGDAPKKGLLLDGSAKLSCEQTLKAMKAIQSGNMPPKSKLTPEEAGEVFQALLDLSSIGGVP